MEVELFGTAVQIGTDIIPRVAFVVFVGVRPCICQIHFTRLWSHIRKGIENVCELFCWQILGVVVAPVNSLIGLSSW